MYIYIYTCMYIYTHNLNCCCDTFFQIYKFREMLNKADDSIKLISMSTANRDMTRRVPAKFHDTIYGKTQNMIYIYFMNKIVFMLNIPKQKGRTIKK